MRTNRTTLCTIAAVLMFSGSALGQQCANVFDVQSLQQYIDENRPTDLTWTEFTATEADCGDLESWILAGRALLNRAFGSQTCSAQVTVTLRGEPAAGRNAINEGLFDGRAEFERIDCPLDMPERLHDTPFFGIEGGYSHYAVHAGNGWGRRWLSQVDTRWCDSILISSPEPQRLRLPIRIIADASAAESLGDANFTQALARCRISGELGGEAIQGITFQVESVSVIPEKRRIDQTAVLIIDAPAGVSDVPVNILIETYGRTTARGAFFITGAATLSVGFNITAGPFSGADGDILPGTIISSATDGGVYYRAPQGDCRPDYTGDGNVDGADFLEFLSLFFAGDSRADFNGDGVVDGGDFLGFLQGFFEGC